MIERTQRAATVKTIRMRKKYDGIHLFSQWTKELHAGLSSERQVHCNFQLVLVDFSTESFEFHILLIIRFLLVFATGVIPCNSDMTKKDYNLESRNSVAFRFE